MTQHPQDLIPSSGEFLLYAAAATVSKMEIVQTEGSREIAQEIEHYNPAGNPPPRGSISHMDCGDLAPQIPPRHGAAVAGCFLPVSVPPPVIKESLTTAEPHAGASALPPPSPLRPSRPRTAPCPWPQHRGASTHAPDRPNRAPARHLRSQRDRNVNPGSWQGGNAQCLGMAQLTRNACRFVRRAHAKSNAFSQLACGSERGTRWSDG